MADPSKRWTLPRIRRRLGSSAPARDAGGASVPARVPGLDAALHAMQRLRYQVYCLEQHFVDAARCTEGRESDDHDLHAIHFAAATDRGAGAGTLPLGGGGGPRRALL